MAQKKTPEIQQIVNLQAFCQGASTSYMFPKSKGYPGKNVSRWNAFLADNALK